MSRFLTQWTRFVSSGLLAFAIAIVLAPTAANATPFVVKLMQQGSNVVATGGGAFDLSGLTLECSACKGTAFQTIKPSTAWFNIGAATGFGGALDKYTGPITGPASFGSGSTYEATSLASGSTMMFDGTGDNFGSPSLFLPTGYQSGNSLSNTTTWANATFASLGVTPGTYVWTWGTGADQSFTLMIGSAVGVPEPAALGVFGFGLLLIGAFVGLRRRVA